MATYHNRLTHVTVLQTQHYLTESKISVRPLESCSKFAQQVCFNYMLYTSQAHSQLEKQRLISMYHLHVQPQQLARHSIKNQPKNNLQHKVDHNLTSHLPGQEFCRPSVTYQTTAANRHLTTPTHTHTTLRLYQCNATKQFPYPAMSRGHHFFPMHHAYPQAKKLVTRYEIQTLPDYKNPTTHTPSLVWIIRTQPPRL